MDNINQLLKLTLVEFGYIGYRLLLIEINSPNSPTRIHKILAVKVSRNLLFNLHRKAHYIQL